MFEESNYTDSSDMTTTLMNKYTDSSLSSITSDTSVNSSSVANESTSTYSTGGTTASGERSWHIKEYENLKQALNYTYQYGNDLISILKKFSEIDDSLHKEKVFEGPISDDCHENGYIKLEGYLKSLISDVEYIASWIEEYSAACVALEDETMKAKQDVIDSNADNVSVSYVYGNGTSSTGASSYANSYTSSSASNSVDSSIYSDVDDEQINEIIKKYYGETTSSKTTVDEQVREIIDKYYGEDTDANGFYYWEL